jgi:alpha-L-fucosidase
VLLIEANQPFEYSGPGPYDFTLFFATSKDMIHWEHMDPNLGFSKERYMGGPWFHYSNGWYYLISVTKLPLKRYTNCIYRTKDFHDWEAGIYNPIMMPDNMDRMISPLAHELTEEDMQKIATHFNINNSDVDMCDWNGKTLMVYHTGNQLCEGYLAEAVYDGTMDQFLAACFDE